MGLIIDDIKLKESVEQFFEKLNKYFPEHKVFALDSIDKNLRERLSELYKKAGYETAEKFLAEYGYEIISGEEVKKIRSFVIYTPGNEPEIIKNKVANMLSRLNEYYPDRIISRGLQNDHKNLSKSVSGLYQWLGYQNASEMLKAYGFETVYGDGTGGRPENNYQELIDFLKDKYSANSKFKSVGELMFDNPEIKGNLKTLQNKAPELFGMSLSKYFKELGILSSPEPKEPKKVERKKLYHYLVVSVDGLDDNIICATDTRTISEGSFVEVCKLHSSEKYIGSVIETHYFNEEHNLPMPINEMYQYIRKVTKTEIRDIEASKIKYIFCSVRIEGRSDTLYYISPFEGVDVGDIVEVPHNWYGTALGVITKIEHVSEKTAPYSVKKTKRIEKIVRRKNEELNEINNSINNLCHRFGTEEFVNIATDKNIIELYESITHFSSAVFRGIDIDVRNALISLYPNELNPLKHGMKLENGFSQFECMSADVPRIIKEFPNLKALFFAEYWKTGNVYLAYSESGYDSVTEMRLIGLCDFYCRDRWTLVHDPSEEKFEEGVIKYCFDEKLKWENCSFVLPGGNRRLAKTMSISSKPYSKRKSYAASEVIKIRYPENEKLYVDSAELMKTSTFANTIESNDLSGKSFVVTGDLNNYTSREELRKLIELKGGKLAKSISAKTTALITNYPDSGTSKIRKAHELGIEIIDEDEFIERFMISD